MIVRSPANSSPTASLAAYRQKHKQLVSVAGSDGLTKLFVGGGHNHAMPLVRHQAKVILATGQGIPLVTSYDPSFLRFMDDLRKECGNRYIPDVDEDGFSRNGVHATPDNFATVAGHMSDPMSWVTTDNTLYRESLGLRAGYSPEERQIAHELLDIVFEEFDLSDVNLPTVSTGGMRRFSYDAGWKADIAAMLMDPHNFDRILYLIEKCEWVKLIDEYEIVFAFYMQTRLQADRIDKIRQVMDLEYALTGGRGGRLINADKRVIIDTVHYPTKTGTRNRNVQAGPWAVNCLGQIISTGHMRSLFRRFPKTFHVNTSKEIEEYANGKYVVASDITEYDRSMSADAVHTFFDRMARQWDPRFVEMGRRLMFAPYYSRPLTLDGSEGQWVGDPRDPVLFAISAGNRSGHWATSLMAKCNKVIDFLIRCHHLGHKVIGNVRRYLEHREVLSCVNNGDDELAGSTNADALARYRATFEDNKRYGHYKGSPEVGCVLSGKMLLKTEQDLVYKAVSRLYNSAEKKLVPERDAGSFHRKFWPIGWLDSINSVDAEDANPNAADMWRLITDLYRIHLLPEVGADLGKVLADASEALPLQYGALNAADRATLEDPEKLHYRYFPEDLTPEVYNQLASKLPRASFRHIPANYYNGKVNTNE